MKKVANFIFFIIICLTTYSQNGCKCTTVLNQIINTIENGYPGFKEKTKDVTAYESFRKYIVELSGTTDKKHCFDVLKKYVRYFKDDHMIIDHLAGKPTIDQNGSKEPVFMDDEKFKEYLKSSSDKLEGIWSSGDYKIGLIKKDGSYKAFIISSKKDSWKPSEVKFLLKEGGKAVYFMGDHTRKTDNYFIHKECIIYFNSIKVAFVKEFPLPSLPKEFVLQELNELEGFYLRPVSFKTLLFKISSFDYPYAERINKILEDNRVLLNRYENLIIDLRGNKGGADYTYQPILPYLYTNPVRYLNGEYLVTQKLIVDLTNWVKNADKERYADEIEKVKRDIQRMKGEIGKFVPYNATTNFGFTIQDSVYTYPKSVAILIDGKCGNATEKFLLQAKQSKKVKTLGTPTHGDVDYIYVREFKLDCNGYSLHMPTVRMMRLPEYPLDNIGIQPDIYMDKYVEDWVQYAKDYLEK